MKDCNGEPCECSRVQRQAIYGYITLGSGITMKWLEFIEGDMTLEAAKAEAVRILCAHWKGAVVRCWAVSE